MAKLPRFNAIGCTDRPSDGSAGDRYSMWTTRGLVGVEMEPVNVSPRPQTEPVFAHVVRMYYQDGRKIAFTFPTHEIAKGYFDVVKQHVK